MRVGQQNTFQTSTLSNFLGRVLLVYQKSLVRFATQSLAVLSIKDGDTVPYLKGNELARYDLSFRSGGKNHITRKPAVTVECAGYAASVNNPILQHGRMSWPPWSEEPIRSTRWTFPKSDL